MRKQKQKLRWNNVEGYQRLSQAFETSQGKGCPMWEAQAWKIQGKCGKLAPDLGAWGCRRSTGYSPGWIWGWLHPRPTKATSGPIPLLLWYLLISPTYHELLPGQRAQPPLRPHDIVCGSLWGVWKESGPRPPGLRGKTEMWNSGGHRRHAQKQLNFRAEHKRETPMVMRELGKTLVMSWILNDN